MHIVCIPVMDDRGLRAPVAPSLDGAPTLLLVDSSSLSFRAVPNVAERRRSRGCDPCAALDDTSVDVVLVASIDADTLARVARRGVPVLAGASGTAADALTAYMAGRLEVLANGPAR